MAREAEEEFVYKGRDAKTIRERATQTGGSYDNWSDPRIPRYKVRDGKNELRILPPTWVHDKAMLEKWGDNWGIEIWLHYSIGPDDNAYLCANKMLGERCYLCEARSELGASDEKASDALQPNKRTFVYVLDRRDEDAGPQLWGMPWKKVEAEIQYRSEDKKKGALMIDHPDDGYDVMFNKGGKGDRTEYTGVEIAREESPLSDNPKTQRAWLAFVRETPLPKALKFYDNDYLEAVFRGKAPKKGDTAPAEGESSGKSGRATRDEKKPKKISASDVEDMDREELIAAIKSNKLDVDEDDFPKTEKLRAAVLKALEKSGAVDDDDKGKDKDDEPSPTKGSATKSRSEDDDEPKGGKKRLDAVNRTKLDVMDEDDLADLIKEYKLGIDPEDYPKVTRLREKVANALKDKDLLDEEPESKGGGSGRAKRETKKLDPISQDRLDDMEEADLEKLSKDYELGVEVGDAPLKVIRREVRAALKEKNLFEAEDDKGDGDKSSASRAQSSIDRMKNKHRGE